eukprot:scaffold319218_cov33-Tisochrysis_lutea.AAC.1
MKRIKRRRSSRVAWRATERQCTEKQVYKPTQWMRLSFVPTLVDSVGQAGPQCPRGRGPNGQEDEQARANCSSVQNRHAHSKPRCSRSYATTRHHDRMRHGIRPGLARRRVVIR